MENREKKNRYKPNYLKYKLLYIFTKYKFYGIKKQCIYWKILVFSGYRSGNNLSKFLK